MPFSRKCGAAIAVMFCVAIAGVFSSVTAHAITYFSGHVSDSQGNAIAGAMVEAATVSPFGLQAAGLATTDERGNYAITSLEGSNASEFSLLAHASAYVRTIYPNVYCTDPTCVLPSLSAPLIAPRSGVNFTLLRSAFISGHVTQTDTDMPVANVRVVGQTVTSGDLGFPRASSDELGSYRIADLPPGVYTLQTDATTQLLAQAYAGHNLDDTLNPARDVVTLVEGQAVRNVDFALDRGATISGLLTSALNGAPVNAQVELSRIGTDAVPDYVGVSIGTGPYQSGLLAPGTFHVQFGEGDAYQPLFYLQALTEAHAQQVTLAAGEQRSGINAQLAPTRTIAGAVTDASTGQPVQNVAVHAGVYGGFIPVLQSFADALTDAAGNYLLQGLDAGSYYIWADNTSGYVEVFYPGTGPCCDAPPTAASSVPLGASESKTGVDFALQHGARASGRVYDVDTGFAALGVQITVFDADGNGWPGTLTDANGMYTSVEVPVGSYYIAALGVIPPHLSFYYPSYICAYPDCHPPGADLVQFSAAQVYQNLDLAIPHLDLIFRSGFEP